MKNTGSFLEREKNMPPIAKISEVDLQAVCDILGHTSDGLSGSEIGQLLASCSIEDPQPGATKKYRLFQALSQHQRRDNCANNVVLFIQTAMSPVRYIDNQARFSLLRDHLNLVLTFMGYQLGEDGMIRYGAASTTLSEAERRAGSLRTELSRRSIHPDVLRFCTAELLQDNYFHAVLEATKSIADKIRQKTGLIGDGSSLVDAAFSLNTGPKLAFNTLQTDSERSEHTGLMNLMKGIFSTFRNPTAHAPKVSWAMGEQDALDLLTMVSFIHRRLDQAVPTEK